MIYNDIFSDGHHSSLLGFGAMRFPTLEGGDSSIDEPRARRMLKLAIDSGVNYFDTAYVYHGGKSETFLGSFLADYPRESFFLADKLPMWAVETPEDADRIFEEQLKRCGVKYFDFYLAHSISAPSFEKLQRLGIVELLERKREEGKLRRLGFSFHGDAECLRGMLDYYSWDFCQLQINYADWNRFGAKEFYSIAEERKLPIIVMEPVRGGFLANPPQAAASLLHNANPNRSTASWAMRFVASLPQVKLVLSGMTEIEQVQDNLLTFSDPGVYLTNDERETVEQAIQALDAIHTVPCTGCRYCMPCPSGVDIPAVFGCYNNAHFLSRGNGGYNKLKAEQQAIACVSCGACESVCPQHIKIPELLKEAHECLSKAE